MRLFVGIVVVGVLAGCAGSGPVVTPSRVPTSGPTTAAARLSLPVRVPATGPVRVPEVAQVERWLGPREAAPSVLQQVVREVRRRTLEQARRPAPTTARCAGAVRLAVGAVTRCTVAYQGLAVPWSVTITDRGASGLYGFRVDTDRYVVRADVAHALIWQLARPSGAREVRCTPIPPVRVRPAGPTGDRCQFVDGSGTREDFALALSAGGSLVAGPG